MFNYKHMYSGRCYILGNGPSLAGFDFGLLKDKIVFGTNRIYLSGYVPDFYVCVNPLVLEQFRAEISELDTVKFISNYVPFDNKKGELHYLDTSSPLPHFGLIEGPIWEGYTVTYVAMKLAYYMGFTEVVLLGIDHDYGDVGLPNVEKVFEGPDANHFHPDYFKGMRWHTPDLRMSEISFSLAKDYFDQVINCSARTKLKVFPVMPLNHILDARICRVSCLVSAYHAEKYLEQCIRDLRHQTEKVEIVVVCQAGSVEEKIAREFGAHQVITTEDIPTIGAAWNIAVSHAHGRYLTTANTDDRYRHDALSLMANLLDNRSDIDLVYADVYVNWEPNLTFDEFEARYNDVTNGRVEGKPGIYAWIEYSRAALGRGCFIGPQPLYRANLHQFHGRFDEEMISAADYDFWLRCAHEANFLHLPMVMGVYLARSDSLEYRTKEVNESLTAQMRAGISQIGITRIGDQARLELGNDWGYVPVSDLKKLLVQL